MVLPILALIIGFKLASPWACQLMNGGMPCPFFSPMYVPPTAPKPAAPAASGPPASAAQINSFADYFDEDEQELAEIYAEDYYNDVYDLYDSAYAHL